MTYLLIAIFIGIFLAVFTTFIDQLKFKRLENRLENSFSKLNNIGIQTSQENILKHFKYTSNQMHSLILILEASGYKSCGSNIERDINSSIRIYPDLNEFKFSTSYKKKTLNKRNGTLNLNKNILTYFDNPSTYEFS